MTDEMPGPVATITHDGFQISGNEGTAEQIKANLEAEPAPLDGSPDEVAKEKEKAAKKERSEAAATLGKAGGEAAARARVSKDDLQGDGGEKDKETADDAPKKGITRHEDDEEADSERRRHDPVARIKQLAREKNEERQKRQELEERLARLEADRAPAKVPAEQPEPGGKPTPDKFDTYEDYVEALTDHKMEERLRRLRDEAEVQRRAQAAAQETLQKVERFNERVAKTPEVLQKVDSRLLELQPTFTLAPGATPGPGNDLAEEIVSSEMAPQLLLYLTEHEEEVRRILALPNAREIARAVAKLEDKLSTPGAEAPPEPLRPTFSQAKPPVRPVTPTPSTPSDQEDEDTPFDELVRIRNAQRMRAMRAR